MHRPSHTIGDRTTFCCFGPADTAAVVYPTVIGIREVWVYYCVLVFEDSYMYWLFVITLTPTSTSTYSYSSNVSFVTLQSKHSGMPLLARYVLATTNRRPGSFVLAYTERRRRYEAPDELRPLWPWCSPVGRGKARATCVCGRGAVMCSLGAPGCVTGRLFHPGDCVAFV